MKDINKEKKAVSKKDDVQKKKSDKLEKTKNEKKENKEEKEARQKRRDMRKKNMRIFPIYKKLAWDYLFYYTIDFLFLTQAKGISASDVILKNTFYALFIAIMQIPASIIVELLGRKNSTVLANILNCFYMIIIMLSKNLADLVLAELLSAIAFSIKNVSEPSLLSESIPPSRYKSEIYSKINSKGATGYYNLNAISKILSGFLFMINPYIPICCSLVISIVTVILSAKFIEPVRKKKSNNGVYIKQLTDMTDGFKFVLKSERLKALILCASLVTALLSVLNNYYVSLFEDLNISASIIGIIAALGSFFASYSSKNQKIIQEKLKNKTLVTIAFTLSISTIIAGIFGIGGKTYILFIVLVVLMSIIYEFVKGLFNTIIDQYLSNFANEKIDTKIYAVKNLFSAVSRVLAGFVASFLLGRIEIAYCMIIIGAIFTVLYMITRKYMKPRVGLKPEEYSKEETKYDSLKVENSKI